MIQHTVDSVFTALKSLEELTYPRAKILPNFSRSIQLDRYSCGAKCVYCVLRYFGEPASQAQVERLLRTDSDGTAKSDIGRVLKRFRLKCSAIKDLASTRRAIKRGSPVLISTHDSWHYCVVYGYSKGHVFVMNPSIGPMGSLRCAVPKKEFRWDQWGLMISKRKGVHQ